MFTVKLLSVGVGSSCVISLLRTLFKLRFCIRKGKRHLVPAPHPGCVCWPLLGDEAGPAEVPFEVIS